MGLDNHHGITMGLWRTRGETRRAAPQGLGFAMDLTLECSPPDRRTATTIVWQGARKGRRLHPTTSANPSVAGRSTTTFAEFEPGTGDCEASDLLWKTS